MLQFAPALPARDLAAVSAGRVLRTSLQLANRDGGLARFFVAVVDCAPPKIQVHSSSSRQIVLDEQFLPPPFEASK